LFTRICGLADDFPKLTHPIGAERKDDVGQSSHVAQEGISVLLVEPTIAEERFDARPFALGRDARVHVEVSCLAFGMVKRILAKNSGSPEYGDSFGRPALAVVCFLGANKFRD